MFSTVVVLVLWAVDKHLLSKVWTLTTRVAKNVAWSALSLYTAYKSTNELIKDGLHIDEAFLYEYHDDSDTKNSREIDVLRIFRKQVHQLQSITQSKCLPLTTFIELCCDPDSNFSSINPTAHYDLVVSYTFDFKKYKIIYGTDNHRKAGPTMIRFPLYTDSAIRKKEMSDTNILTAAMLTANYDDEDGIDIYPQLKQLAGPLENFYTDTDFKLLKNHLHYTGLRVTVENMYIKILDAWGTEFTVPPEHQEIRLEK